MQHFNFMMGAVDIIASRKRTPLRKIYTNARQQMKQMCYNFGFEEFHVTQHYSRCGRARP